jgi:molybdate transport system regulatory protein
VITNYSQTRLGLKPGILVVAEVKAPWVTIFKSGGEPVCTAENRFRGTVSRIVKGKVATEIVVRIDDGIELCSIVTDMSRRVLNLRKRISSGRFSTPQPWSSTRIDGARRRCLFDSF